MQKLSEAAYRSIADALRRQVDAEAPDWTRSNDSDPGVVMLKLFAFLTEQLIYRTNETPERARPIALRLAQSALRIADGCPAASSGALQRVHYFTGQLLGAADFEQEQGYIRERLRRLNRELHGSGIVRGLEVSVRPSETGTGDMVVVEPGFALAPNGEEIEVPVVATEELPPRGQHLHLNLRHAERPSRPTSSGSDEPEFSRIEETFSISLEASPADDGLALARLRRDGSGWRTDGTFEARRILHRGVASI